MSEPLTSDVLAVPGRSEAPRRSAPPGRRMVSWYDPSVLAKTGLKALLSSTIGKQADRRLLDAVASPQPLFFDFSVDDAGRPRDELWLDYVSDLGDGWDSTYAVALAVAQQELVLKEPSGVTHATRAGEVLVFGGDAVYPTASLDEYQARTVRPYEAALRHGRAPPHLFAVPGNHDWYDGLVSFLRLFCQGRQSKAWRTHQRRSYFALKLPRGWWLLGTDMQLESDLDAAQVTFFENVAEQMGDGDRVILCNAEPAWIYQQVKPVAGRAFLDNNLDFLQDMVLGKKVSVFLAGDLHHYRRHENAEGQQKIVAGGGGAFLHPTHLPRVDSRPGGFELKESYPRTEVSRRITWRNLGFVAHNPWFGVFMGFVYALLGWGLAADLNATGTSHTLGSVLAGAIENTGSMLMGAVLLLGMYGFADTRRGSGWRRGAGILHGAVHLVAALLLTWAASALAGRLVGPNDSLGRDVASGLLLFVSGFLVGPTLMGAYLVVSLNVFGCHPNEAFSSLAIPDWKNFLRLRIDREGRLTVYPVGIRRVPRAWKPGETVREPEWVADPKDTRATPPELIEPPIVLGATKTPPGEVGKERRQQSQTRTFVPEDATS
ncbi:metallophosphoesterase family protein [Pyxidicoccus fallax]|uniref:metallophosphoesterase family protein n=1 Tax=Pyxidicoccus fallax TaxID=394095 RepID=UPI001FE52DB9|nr:metallophosphoesterase [Pyxidicoccus fallax]